MTFESKIVVGLDDIKAVIFQCRKCPTRVAVQPDNIRVPHQCPQCGQRWTPEHLETHEVAKQPAYIRFCTAMSECRTLQENDAAFSLLLEFEGQS